MSCSARGQAPALFPLETCLLLACALLWACSLCACGEGELEVQGSVDRVVGETVTLALVEGEQEFTGGVSLVAADETSYSSTTLKAYKKDGRNLTFVIPPGVAAGKATVKVERQDSEEPYEVPLNINRLALARDTGGTLQILPLPPSSIEPSSLSLGSTTPLISLSPDGALLAVATSTEIRLLSVGQTPKDITVPIKQTGTTCLAAVADGVLIGTKDTISYNKVSKGGVIKQATFVITDCQDISVDSKSYRAMVLSQCDTNSDLKGDSDCVYDLLLTGTPKASTTPSVLDSTMSATDIRITSNGSGAVVMDGGTLYGLVPSGSAPSDTFTVSTITLEYKTSAVSIARSNTQRSVSGKMVDFFAVSALGTKDIIRVAGIDDKVIKWVIRGSGPLEVALSMSPGLLAFGRELDLYMALSTKIYRVNLYSSSSALTDLKLDTSSEIKDFIVQPRSGSVLDSSAN